MLSTRRHSTTPHNANAAAYATSPNSKGHFIPAFHSDSRSDDALLKAHFDQPAASTSAQLPPAGLFLYPPLDRPGALRLLTDRTLIHSQALVRRICSARDDPSGRELRLVVKNLDRLSDILCGVIDMCELVRNAHPDPAWVAESDLAYERLCSYMNELNINRGLYEVLVATLEHQHAEPMSEAEKQVALTFLRDFEKSGIHLPPSVRAQFVEISDNLISLGRTFLSNISAGPSTDQPIVLPDYERLLAGMGSRFINSLESWNGTAYVAPGSWEAQMIARYARDSEARRIAYTGSMRADPDRIEVLEAIIKQRAQVAGVLGKDTWADVVLTDKMAKSPSNVINFLNSLAEHHRPAAVADAAALQRLKASTISGNSVPPNTSPRALPPLYAWDREYFTDRCAMTMSSASNVPSISPYLSVGTALLGLSKLFSRLYGISFKPAPVAPGEVWHPSVRRLNVIDETEGEIGVIYCDLFSREGKTSSAAHFTVRCSRRVDDDDVQGDGLEYGWAAGLGDGLESEGAAIRGKEGRYQLPIIVLCTDFGTPSRDAPALLTWNDFETLFHEMGHAIHCEYLYAP